MSNEVMKDIMKRVKSFEDSSFSIEGIIKTIKSKTKKSKIWILWYLSGYF